MRSNQPTTEEVVRDIPKNVGLFLGYIIGLCVMVGAPTFTICFILWIFGVI